MTDLSLLKVSLTKHNAHKIAFLLKEGKADDILTRLDEVHAEEAQARKNLSILSGNKVPEVWEKAQKLGENAIDALVFVGIVFSHHRLIDAMINASNRVGFSGRIERGDKLDEKDYTNFSRVIDQLGFATKLESSGVTFNLKAIFEIFGMGELVRELLTHKLDTAGWDHSSSLEEEAIAHNFHKVFGVEPDDLKKWLSDGVQPATASSHFLPKDESFFQETSEGSAPKDFEFKSGHTERTVEPITRNASTKTQVNQLHNDMQNRLFEILKDQKGASCVGAEQDTGSGTSIDIVTKCDGITTFFEIKTSPSVRANIRQAIPQLLEYAYWPEGKRADELVIVSHLQITPSAERYISYLRKEFKIPLSYRQLDLNTNKLI